MKAKETELLEFMRTAQQFIIPVYQRMYSWDIKQCEQLWNDILRIGSNANIKAHFVGSIVYIHDDIYSISATKPLSIIDGQQRITTITLLLIALHEILHDEDEFIGISKIKIQNQYLLNPYEKADTKYKLILSQNDKDTLIAIIDTNKPTPSEESLKIKENLRFFREQLQKHKNEIEQICIGLNKLVIVDIALKRPDDNPQLIFESMNSTGKALSQADLIRNYILMGLESQEQTRLYEKYWREIEKEFGQEPYEKYFNNFMRDYLTLKTRNIPNENKVYEAFKKYIQENKIDTESFLQDLKAYSEYFCNIALDKEKDSKLQIAFRDLRELKVDVAYPFLLEVYDDYKNNIIPKDDFEKIVRLVESFVFRRAVCKLPTNSLNKIFPILTKDINKQHYLQNIEAKMLQKLKSRFPNDTEFESAFMTRDLYNFNKRMFYLRKLENHKRKEFVDTSAYTIEHIMPQNENLSPQWQQDLGENYQEIQEKYLHTLGNLTLTGYNSEYKDKPFTEKRDMQGGFKESPLRLNEGLRQIEIWNEEAIKQRANKLAKEALDIWRCPTLSKEILESYKPKNKLQEIYTTKDNHPYLTQGKVKELFEALEKEILLLDSNITREVLKLKIAYKLDTNFVDIIPKKSNLKLTLNIDLDELDDPKAKARDISNIGKLGTGNTEVKLEDINEIPYIITLVRQSLEKQLGE
ncbi:hypothetical protein CQA53_07915 [Helicobacter didelphidarum]|uniref:DUF262 domain-containing protein n=1 Tax=Helicobacter didelphidarum TaxID=2040648 RepID=A0A3D8IG09_9HELI|nr:DUF262 and DUF1524 domain-containing protein [Helicobacter didelphidarum]RDU64058.1 hypothetical protein CQA53_07915 [Helicobacter didelphidarum]